MTFNDKQDLLPFQMTLIARLRDVQPVLKQRKGRQRRDLRIGMGAAAIATAAGVLALALGPAEWVGRSPSAESRSSLFLASQVSGAVEETDDKILQTYETSSSPGQPDLRFEGWWDQGRGNRTRMVQLDPNGKAISESIFTVEGDKGVLISIDHATATWWTRTRDLSNGKVATWMPAPATIRFTEEIAEGEAEILGQEEVEGVDLIHVRDTSKPGLQRDMWLFLDTYLPVRRVTTDQFGNRFEMTFKWLPRTSANLQLLEPDLSGLKQVDPPAPAQPHSDGTLG